MFLLNLQKNFDQNNIQCDFLVLDDGETYDYEEKLRSLSANVYKLKGVWLDSPIQYLNYKKAIEAFFREHHDYAAVHMNGTSKNFMFLHYAKKYGIKKRIVHSHSTDFQTNNIAKKIIGNILKKPMMNKATDFFACSEIAGKWLFGKKAIATGKVHIVPNAIDLDKFEFKLETRKRVRKELKINDDQILIGHVGRFAPEKNHKYLLKIFAEVHKLDPSAVLIMAGDGDLQDDIKAEAVKLKITEYVRFLGFRNDVSSLTQAMDVFLMPSFYEGFPVTGIEAQASGCPCVFSDTITKEAVLLDETIYISLAESVENWAKKTLETAHGSINRDTCKKLLKEKGFDIHDITKNLEYFYIL